ncbi:MAG TPA: DMT family transporter [Solirubrobacterales bacterium]|nr:DMT family transporter [Solirubrobacterales bacterium]
MSAAPAVLIMLAVSAQFALQAPLNARLAVATGPVPAALVSFLVGLVALGLAVLLSGGAGGFADIDDASAWQFTGGLIGAAFVLTALVAVPIVGAGGVAAATITGQMVGSIALDAAGALGLDPEPVTVARVVGPVLLLAGTLLILHRGDRRAEAGASTRRRLAAAFIVVAGLALATQAPINAGLGDSIGGLEAALVNFVVGSLVLALAALAVGGMPAVPVALEVPRRYLLGGVIGAIYVAASVLLVREIGAGGIAATTVTGQLACSVALDRVGALGLERRPLTAVRIAAVGLLIGGTCLIVA